ncbi:MAG: efflux RND transporter periplasmic adaptor subunit [Pseudomonadota bacterium]
MRRPLFTLLTVCCAGVGLIALIATTGPEPLQAAQPPAKPQVAVATLDRTQEPITVSAVGTLVPRQTLSLTTQVPGEITWVSQSLDAGRHVEAGDKLLQIDERDYVIAVASAEALHAQAQANIALEEGRAEIARLEWQAWKSTSQDAEQAGPLALREPQKADAVARRRVIDAQLRGARLALQRTAIKAPWSATIAQANAIIGQVLSVGDVTAVLMPLDFAIVELQVPIKTARTLDQGVDTIEIVPVDDPDATPVLGRFEGIVRNLTSDTRLATLRVRIDEPLAHPGWAYGMHLRARIQARQTRPVALVPADLVVNGNLVWVYRDGAALRHRLTPTGGTPELVSVADSFEPSDRLIVDRPIGLLDGVSVELREL